MASYTAQRACTPTPCGVLTGTSMLVAATTTSTTTTSISIPTSTTTPPGELLTGTTFKLPASSRSSTAYNHTTPPPISRPQPAIPMTRRPSSPLLQARYSPLVLSSAQIERSLTDPFSDRPLSRSGSAVVEDAGSSPTSTSASQTLATSQRTSSFVTLLKASGTPGAREARLVRSARREISRGMEEEAEKHRDAVASRQQSGQYALSRPSAYSAAKTGDTTEEESEIELIVPPKKPVSRAASATFVPVSGAARPRYTPPIYVPESPSAQFEREAEMERVAEADARRDAILETIRAAASRHQSRTEALKARLRSFTPLTGDNAEQEHEEAVQRARKDDESSTESDSSRTSTKRKAACQTTSSHDEPDHDARSPRRRKTSPAQPRSEHAIFTASRRLHSLTSPSSISLPNPATSLDCHHDHTTCPLLHRLGLITHDTINIRSPHPRTSIPRLAHCPVHPATTNVVAECHLRVHDRRWLHKQAHIWASLQARLETVAEKGCRNEWEALKIRECSEGFMKVVQEAWRGLWMCEVSSENGIGAEDDEGDKENLFGRGGVRKRLGAFGRVRRMDGGVSSGGGALQMLAQGEVVVRPVEHAREQEEKEEGCDLSRVEMVAEQGTGVNVQKCEESIIDKGKNESKEKSRKKRKEKKKGRRLTPLMDEYDVKSPNYTNEEFRRSWNSVR